MLKRTDEDVQSAMNGQRAEWAEAAVQSFRAATGTDRDDSLVDLLADLMHWATANGRDFDTDLETARMHYQCELEDGE